MKSFFSRLQSGADSKKVIATDEELQGQLKVVQVSLQKMRKANEEDFPLLNESTRLGTAAEPSCLSFKTHYCEKGPSPATIIWPDGHQLNEMMYVCIFAAGDSFHF